MRFPLTPLTVRALGEAGRFSLEDFAELFGLKESSGQSRPCPRRLVGKQCKAWRSQSPYGHWARCDCQQVDMGIDHPFLFYRPGDSRCGALAGLVWFPYQAEPDDAQRLLEWTEPRGLQAAVLPRGTGWYGGPPDLLSYMVVVWRSWPLSEREQQVQVKL